MYENVGRAEKLCNYSLARANITMTSVKKRLLCAWCAFVCSLVRQTFSLSVNVGRAAVKLGEIVLTPTSRYYWRNEKGERAHTS